MAMWIWLWQCGAVTEMYRNCGVEDGTVVNARVADPHSFYPDPASSFYAEYQCGSRALMTKNWKKITAEKKI